MADKKISALTAATTPLAGTEVLPIVQSGATVKVAVSDLTAGRSISASAATITGDLTVDTTTLKVDSTNNRIGVGTSTPSTTVNVVSTVGPILRLENPETGSSTGLSMGKIEWYTGDASAPGVVGSINVQDYNNFGTAFKMELGGGLVGAVVPALRLDAGADVTVITGNLVIGTSGKGISLPGGITWTSGSGSPEGVVTAPVGSLYSRSDGGLLTSLYVKESGSGNTGWVGK